MNDKIAVDLARDASGAIVHTPVMLPEVIKYLAPALQEPDSIYVDGTLGMGGHATAILQNCPAARLIGIDQDADALAIAGKQLAPFGARAELVRARFDELPEVLATHEIANVSAILVDLGVSSWQIDQPERGFAYRFDAPLDMRMDDRNDLNAYRVVNEYQPDELVRVLTRYGEEPHAKRIVRAIVSHREQRPIETTTELVEIITEAMPASVRYKSGGHPAKRTFQALRIEVNAELQALENFLPAALDALAVGGRLAVLAYHSLEDRIVKQTFAAASTDQAPRNLPIVPEALTARMQLVTRGAKKASAEEVEANPRAASVRLRVIERVKEG